ncbi:MAG: acetyl-CoA carboxylase biotin carboxyl carrier protein subunit [Bacteroidota bacterium]
MDNAFKVKVNDTFTFDLAEGDISKLDALSTSGTEYHILQDNRPFQVKITNSDFNNKTYEIKVNNNAYSVNIADALDLLINEMGFSLASAKDIGSIEAPMPGLILEINVAEGQEVQEDEQLMILEAMKMENVITSPRNGVIKTVAVSKGEAVEKKHLLIEFE